MTDSGSPSATFGVETIELDLPPLAGALSRRLHDAGVPVTPARSADFARALALVRPISRRRLYWTARAVLVSDPAQVKAFDAVFFAVFGERDDGEAFVPQDAAGGRAAADDSRQAVESQDVARRGRAAASARRPLDLARRTGAVTRTATRSTCRSRWRATRSGSPAGASTGSSRTSWRSSTG